MTDKKTEALKLAQIAMRGVWAAGLTGSNVHSFEEAMERVEEALAEQPEYRAVKTWHEGNPVYVTEQPAQQQEPLILRFNEWTVGKNDFSDYICVGELTLAGIEDNLGGPEFGEPEIEQFDDVIYALQEKLVTGRECKKVPLIAYIGTNTSLPASKPWVGLTDEEFQMIYDLGRTPTGMMELVEAKLKEKNT